nr:transposase [Actinacidiphila oryziradicis]
MFADLFAEEGRHSVPPMIVAVVMVLQRLEGLSDREAVDRFAFDVRWKYAAGGLDFDHPGFVHTVLVDFRARLAASGHPDRIFATTVEVAGESGLRAHGGARVAGAGLGAVAPSDGAGGGASGGQGQGPQGGVRLRVGRSRWAAPPGVGRALGPRRRGGRWWCL